MTFEEKIKSLDNDPSIMGFIFLDGSPVWLAIRFRLRLLQMESYSDRKVDISGGQDSQKSLRLRLFKYILLCIKRRPKYANRKIDVLTLGNYEDNPDCPNRMTTAIRKCADFQSQEWLYSPQLIGFPKIKDTYSFDYFYYISLIRVKWKQKLGFQKPTERFEKLFDLLRSKLSDDIPNKKLDQLQLEVMSIYPLTLVYRSMVKKALRRVNPKLVLCSEGNNGDWRQNILFSVSKELGIPSAEVQHGTFNLGMKYGSELVKKDEFQKYKTNYLFTFGNYHCSQTNLPSICYPLGHYPLEMELSKIAAPIQSNYLRILFVCEGLPPSSKDNAFIRAAYEALSRFEQPFKLTVRLHHSEQADAKYDPFFNFNGTSYSQFETESIYGLLAHADIVIMHASTVAFESIYFGKQPLVFHDENTADYVPRDIGLWFKNADELLRFMNQHQREIATGEQARGIYWAEGKVIDNFKEFWTKNILKVENVAMGINR